MLVENKPCALVPASVVEVGSTALWAGPLGKGKLAPLLSPPPANLSSSACFT